MVLDAPWDDISDLGFTYENDPKSEDSLINTLLEHFKIKKEKEEKYYPTLGYSLKPFVLLFDEIYTDLYRIGEAQQRMIEAKKWSSWELLLVLTSPP